jgi:flagellar protein FlgJ
MSVESLGSYYLNEARLGPGSLAAPLRGAGGVSGTGETTPEGLSFSALIDRTREDAAPKPRAPVRVDKTDKLYEQCEALETFLVKTLVTGMRKTIQKTEFLDGGFAGEMYEDMLYDEYARDMSRNAGFGLAELAYLELTGQRGKLMRQGAPG